MEKTAEQLLKLYSLLRNSERQLEDIDELAWNIKKYTDNGKTIGSISRIKQNCEAIEKLQKEISQRDKFLWFLFQLLLDKPTRDSILTATKRRWKSFDDIDIIKATLNITHYELEYIRGIEDEAKKQHEKEAYKSIIIHTEDIKSKREKRLTAYSIYLSYGIYLDKEERKALFA